MKRLALTLPLCLVLAGAVLALAPFPPRSDRSSVQEPPPGDGEKKPPQKPTQKKSDLTLVKVDIAEEVDGREYAAHQVQFSTVKILLTGALDVESARETRWDKQLGSYKPRKEGPADFVVKGEARVELKGRPTWYGGVVAYIYRGVAEITIEDGEGNEVHAFDAELERSHQERDKAITKTLDRIGRLVTRGVMECDEIRSRVHPKREKNVQDILDKIQVELDEFGGDIRVVSRGGESTEDAPPGKGKGDGKAKKKQR